MNSDQLSGEYRGIPFEYDCSSSRESGACSGTIHFPDDPHRHAVTSGGADRWDTEVRDMIDRYFREIDVEPDDDSEA